MKNEQHMVNLLGRYYSKLNPRHTSQKSHDQFIMVGWNYLKRKNSLYAIVINIRRNIYYELLCNQ